MPDDRSFALADDRAWVVANHRLEPHAMGLSQGLAWRSFFAQLGIVGWDDETKYAYMSIGYKSVPCRLVPDAAWIADHEAKPAAGRVSDVD